MLFFVLSLCIGGIFGAGAQLALGSKNALQSYAIARGSVKATTHDYPKTVAAWVVFLTVIAPFLGVECLVSTLVGTRPVLFTLWISAVTQALGEDMPEDAARDLTQLGDEIIARY